MEALVAEGKTQPAIVVAVWNTGGGRLDDYGTVRREVKGMGMVGGGGDDYVRFLAEQLKPEIDRTCATSAFCVVRR